jgi:CubicO group peptidase (beta-lactamase class C family)
MRLAVFLGLSLALSACATARDAASRAAIPSVTQSAPATAASTAPADSLLFWSEPRRSAAFRAMETLYPGLEVEPAARPRPLPRAARALPEAVQTDLRRFMGETRAAGIMVLHDGRVVFEDYGLGFGPAGRWTSFSVAKSFTSTLLGAAIRDGAIPGLETPVTAVLPELAGSAYDGVSVGQVAAMTSGVAWNEDYTSPDSDVARFLAVTPVKGESQVVTYARTLKRAAKPGEKWTYNTLETGLLGLIVERATGKSLAAYAAEKIVTPAGFAGKLFWMQDLTGGNIGGCCLSLRLADYARFGQWVLEGGQPSVPAGWFAAAGAPRSDLGSGYGYGYQWWTYPEGFGAQGIFGQAITIVPRHRLVIAVVSNYPTATGRELTQARRAMLARLIEAVAVR